MLHLLQEVQSQAYEVQHLTMVFHPSDVLGELSEILTVQEAAGN